MKYWYIKLFPLLITFFLLSSNLLWGQELRKQEQIKEKLEREIRFLDKQLQKNKNKESYTLKHIVLINKKITTREILIKKNNSNLIFLSKQIDTTKKSIQELENKIDRMSIYYSKLLKKIYLNRNYKVWYLYILASKNINQAFLRYKYLRNISIQMNIEAEKIRTKQQELKKEQERLSNLINKTERLNIQNKEEVSKLNLEKKEKNQVISTLKKNQNSYIKEIKEKKQEVLRLQRKIEKLIKESIAEASSIKNKKKTQIIDYKLSSNFNNNKGKLPWPCKGIVIEYFGQNYHPIYKGLKLPYNNGISILPEDSNIYSIFNGIVKAIVVVPGYNQCILVQHGEYFSFYCKLSKVVVKVGDTVKTKELLGEVPDSQEEKSFHFEIWKGKKAENPLNWLAK